MFRNVMKFAMLPVMALSLVVAACDTAGELQPLTGPQVGAPSFSDDVTSFTVVKESDVTIGVVTGIIGSGGGKLVLGKHELWVPRDAVSASTVFSMSKASSELRFSLTATRLTTNDIGSRGFAQPVKLVISYKDAVNVSNPSQLKVFWARLDGTLEAQQTDVDLVGYRAVGYLNHFSDYLLAMP